MSNNNSAAASSSKKMKWYTIGLMAFSTVWGFGNVVNGFAYFHGTQVIFSWILMFALYFVPYALMVGELGSAFKNLGGGVTSWVLETTSSPKLAYYAGYTYWVVHIPYIASKGNGGLNALSWVFLKNEWYKSLPGWQSQLAILTVFLIFCWVATRGLSILKPMSSLAGTTCFIMSLLYILMMFAAPAINPNAGYVSLNFSWENIIPQFNWQYFTSLSILVFAVGGCEKISPYVNKVENPAKNFPKGMIALAIMVMVCAILGTIAMGMMFDITALDASPEAMNYFIANGQYECFLKLGEYYHVGYLFTILYAISNAIGQFSVLILSIDAPLRMLLDDENARQFVPKGLLKQNKYGAYTNGIWMIVVLSGAIIVIQMMGTDAADIIAWLTKLNSVCMPMRYLWVFFAYIMLRRQLNKFHPEYRFIPKSANGLALFFGGWCFFVTAFCCILGCWADGDVARTIMNFVTPFVLLALGLIMPEIRKMQDKKSA